MNVALVAVIAVTSLLGGVGVASTSLAPPARADAVGPVTVVIDRLTPVVPRADGRLRVEGRVVNTTTNAMDDVVIRLRLSSEPVTRRSQITRVRQSPLDTENQEPTPEQLDQRTAPDSWPEPADAIVDKTQIEGVQSTGANAVQRYRFGVIPQITPVLLSQLLYFLESNTRSATIIGAITGGGIGLMLTQAIITQKDWEEVAYYIVLIILMVIFMDWFSGWLRRRLIKGDEGGH